MTMDTNVVDTSEKSVRGSGISLVKFLNKNYNFSVLQDGLLLGVALYSINGGVYTESSTCVWYFVGDYLLAIHCYVL